MWRKLFCGEKPPAQQAEIAAATSSPTVEHLQQLLAVGLCQLVLQHSITSDQHSASQQYKSYMGRYIGGCWYTKHLAMPAALNNWQAWQVKGPLLIGLHTQGIKS